jgi:glycosyltransferase involved in cell wall biosynthesis
MPDASNNGELELTIVMPCLNEAETLETCIRKAQSFLEKNSIRGEVLIGDNGSTDGSQEIARRCGGRVVDVPVRGYGAALFHATLAAQSKYVIMGDSDNSYDFSNLMPFVEKLREGYELVMGNRFKGGIKPGAMPWKNRYIGNPALSGIGRILFRCPISDFHCGLRGYTLDAFRRMDLRTTGMEFASEMVIKATLLQLRIAEVPTTLSPDGRSRAPHLRPWRDGWRHLRFMLLCSPRWLFLYPGLLMIAVGLGVGAWLLPGPREVFGMVLDIHTLLYAAIVVVAGFQAVAFALFARIFAVREGVLPRSPRLDWLLKSFNLELGVLLGLLLVFSGLAGSLATVMIWRAHAYRNLNPSDTLRVVIPSVLAFTLGCQVVLSSFFMSVLGLGVRK